MTVFPGSGKTDLFATTTTTPEQREAARREVRWHARTDTEERRLLAMLGLDQDPAA